MESPSHDASVVGPAHDPGGDGHGVVRSLNRSGGGVPKLPVGEVRVTFAGLEGDRQRNLEHHGGPHRAVCLYSADLIAALRREGHPIAPGSIGENMTIAGVNWGLLLPGVRLQIGEIEVELTGYAFPCRNIADSFLDRRFERVSPKTHPGESRVYARVLREGVVRVGDTVRVVQSREHLGTAG